jgi:hypothetical protein
LIQRFKRRIGLASRLRARFAMCGDAVDMGL